MWRLALVHETREQFQLVLFLDKKNQLIADEVMNRGTVDQRAGLSAEVMRRALELAASAVILVHNHPSGDPRPSRADIEMTCRRWSRPAARSGSPCTTTWWLAVTGWRASRGWG